MYINCYDCCNTLMGTRLRRDMFTSNMIMHVCLRAEYTKIRSTNHSLRPKPYQVHSPCIKDSFEATILLPPTQKKPPKLHCTPPSPPFLHVHCPVLSSRKKCICCLRCQLSYYFLIRRNCGCTSSTGLGAFLGPLKSCPSDLRGNEHLLNRLSRSVYFLSFFSYQ